MRLAHGGLEVERLDVLPVLLEEGDQEVDGQHGVGEDLLSAHLYVANCTPHAENLLELELDGLWKREARKIRKMKIESKSENSRI